jgi:hypothetical protein
MYKTYVGLYKRAVHNQQNNSILYLIMHLLDIQKANCTVGKGKSVCVCVVGGGGGVGERERERARERD